MSQENFKYIQNPSLKTVWSHWSGNPTFQDRFLYPEKPFRNSIKKVLRWQLFPNPQAKEKRHDSWTLPVRKNSAILESKEDFILWLGHATFVFQFQGVRFITDPVFFDLPHYPRQIEFPFPLESLINIDYILLSHDHRDHCDIKSLRLLMKQNQAKILAPLHLGRLLPSLCSPDKIQEAGWYQAYKMKENEPEVIFLPARHWCRRGLGDFNRILWGSFLLRTNKGNIYFGGDSALGGHFEQIGKLFPIDLAILGVGSYQPDYIMQESHMNPEEATLAWKKLGAKTLIPMHYGTYDLTNEPLGEPYRRIKNCFADKEEYLKILEAGEGFFL